LPAPDTHVVDFPTLWVAADWIENHCVVPDRFERGNPFILTEWQLWLIVNHYRVKPDAPLPDQHRPAIGAAAFHYRRFQIVLPQKSGKGPVAAALVLLEGCGPTMFAGWSSGKEAYRCSDHGCPCGWRYEYRLGEPMAIPRPTPLIQLTAYSQEQVDNVYGALRPMVDYGPLSEVVPVTGEAFTRLPGNGRIDVVTSSQRSRLGQRVTYVIQDETGIWLPQNKMDEVAKTQRRGVAGMGGRLLESTNAWDPSENSVAQTTYQSSLKVADIFRVHPLAPPGLSFTNKAERRRILRHVYAGSPWIDVDNEIEPECVELIQHDPGNAERFFGNRIVAGLGAWIAEKTWDDARGDGRTVKAGTAVAAGFDGSESDDWTAITLETQDGYSFLPTYGPDRRPTYWDPREWGGTIPRGEVDAAVHEIATTYRLRRLYADPRDWRSEIGAWALEFGDEVVFEFDTYVISRMFPALYRFRTDVIEKRCRHDGHPIVKDQVLNARKAAKPGDKYLLVKPDRARKIDLAMTFVLAHEAAADLHTEAAWGEPSSVRWAVGKTWVR
jgi:hypothetical protein